MIWFEFFFMKPDIVSQRQPFLIGAPPTSRNVTKNTQWKSESLCVANRFKYDCFYGNTPYWCINCIKYYSCKIFASRITDWIIDYPQVIIAFGTLKIGNHFQRSSSVSNDYFLIGNFSLGWLPFCTASWRFFLIS